MVKNSLSNQCAIDLNRDFHNSPLTKGELQSLDSRVDSIRSLIELTEEPDILLNLQAELTFIVDFLSKSMKIAQFREKGLKLIK